MASRTDFRLHPKMLQEVTRRDKDWRIVESANRWYAMNAVAKEDLQASFVARKAGRQLVEGLNTVDNLDFLWMVPVSRELDDGVLCVVI
jgi:hypothetical protein